MFVTKFRYYPVVMGIPCLRLHEVAIWFASNTSMFGSQYCTTHCLDAAVTVQGVTDDPMEPVYPERDVFEPQIRPQCPFLGNIGMLNRASLFRTVKKGRLTVLKALLSDINWAIEAKDVKESPQEQIVPEQYQEFLPVFSKVLADRLPPHCPGIDHEVQLKEGETATR